MIQYSLFGAQAATPALADLDGVLLAGGLWVGSRTGSRLSVVVDEMWRADALAAALQALEIAEEFPPAEPSRAEPAVSPIEPSPIEPSPIEPSPIEPSPIEPFPAEPTVTSSARTDSPTSAPSPVPRHELGRISVRTVFTPRLDGLASRWRQGATQLPPADLELTPGGLRLWAITSGRLDEGGYLFGTARLDTPVHMGGGSQLSRLGLGAVSVGPRGGPGWRVTSARRLRRLAELLGEPPPGAEGKWPVPR